VTSSQSAVQRTLAPIDALSIATPDDDVDGPSSPRFATQGGYAVVPMPPRLRRRHDWSQGARRLRPVG
jgi:hypothetical protein